VLIQEEKGYYRDFGEELLYIYTKSVLYYVSGRKCHYGSPWDIVIYSRQSVHFCLPLIFFHPTKLYPLRSSFV